MDLGVNLFGVLSHSPLPEAETLQRLYKDSAPAEGGAEGEAADAAQEGGHRRRNK